VVQRGLVAVPPPTSSHSTVCPVTTSLFLLDSVGVCPVSILFLTCSSFILLVICFRNLIECPSCIDIAP